MKGAWGWASRWRCRWRIRYRPIATSFQSRKLQLTRLYSESRGIKTFDIRCGSSGFITVDLHNPHLLSSPSCPLIIYLPPFPSTPSFPTQHTYLTDNFPLLSINYRWSHHPSPHLSSSPLFTNHPFPTPLHDTLHAYTWLLTSYLPSLSLPFTSSPISSRSSEPTPRPLLIFGSQLGGTLATSLSLTESRFPSPSATTYISGLIARDTVFNWTGIATAPSPAPLSSTPKTLSEISTVPPPWDVPYLHALKTKLFSQPSQAFDAFASPILFFRTAGITIPKTWLLPLSPNTSPSLSPSPPPEEELEISRPTALKFPPPPSSSNSRSNPSSPSSPPPLRLPHTLILLTVPSTSSSTSSSTSPSTNPSLPSTGKKQSQASASASRSAKKPKSKPITLRKKRGEEEPPLQVQAKEMVKYMKRSLKYYEFGETGRGSDTGTRAEGDDCGEGEGGREPEEEAIHRMIDDRVQLQGVLGGGDTMIGGRGGEEEIVKGWMERRL